MLEETSDAFSSCGTVNADFADFASLVLSDFKELLNRPYLTDEQLQAMLRVAMMACPEKSHGSSTWAHFIAHYLQQTANSNAAPWAQDMDAAETAGA